MRLRLQLYLHDRAKFVSQLRTSNSARRRSWRAEVVQAPQISGGKLQKVWPANYSRDRFVGGIFLATVEACVEMAE